MRNKIPSLAQNAVPAVTTDQMREVDRLMVEDFGISLEQMMEQAGRNLADLALEFLARRERLAAEVVMACGVGNNGGGGMTAARILHNRGVSVTVVLAGAEDRLKPVPARRWQTLKRLAVRTITESDRHSEAILAAADLVIDAVLGYGLDGDPRGAPADVITRIHRSGNRRILALDVPSGLDATTGKAGNPCLRAQATMTLALPIRPAAREYVGRLLLADIGVPPELYTRIGLPPQRWFATTSILRLVAEE
jgi:NAD(P)H-hydrate epimerase